MDSEFTTRTKTSASKQCLSIQLSKSGVTSIPGLQREIHKVLSSPRFREGSTIDNVGKQGTKMKITNCRNILIQK